MFSSIFDKNFETLNPVILKSPCNHYPAIDDFWRNLSFNKAQTDWIVNQKHFLMLFAIKIKYIYVNE